MKLRTFETTNISGYFNLSRNLAQMLTTSRGQAKCMFWTARFN